MSFPKLPDWLLYGLVVGALVVTANARRERADAPPAPPPPTEDEGALLSAALPFDATHIEDTDSGFEPEYGSGTAFSLGQSGVWLTSAKVAKTCKTVGLLTAPGRATKAKVTYDPTLDLALLTTHGGPPPMVSGLKAPLKVGMRAYIIGYPNGGAGEVTVRLLGKHVLRSNRRTGHRQYVLSWAEVGRTALMEGGLAGLSGAPILNADGQVLGVIIAHAPRRGRFYSLAPETVQHRLEGFHPDAQELKADMPVSGLGTSGLAEAIPQPPLERLTLENYGRVGDALRRDARVSKLICITGQNRFLGRR